MEKATAWPLIAMRASPASASGMLRTSLMRQGNALTSRVGMSGRERGGGRTCPCAVSRGRGPVAGATSTDRFDRHRSGEWRPEAPVVGVACDTSSRARKTRRSTTPRPCSARRPGCSAWRRTSRRRYPARCLQVPLAHRLRAAVVRCTEPAQPCLGNHLQRAAPGLARPVSGQGGVPARVRRPVELLE